uniref:A kinase (PRKA) anchor protein 8-like n=1 Tax=Neogobius melanostomus TaxID=47308 RepID=A0A8C6S2Q2_9GOBI
NCVLSSLGFSNWGGGGGGPGSRGKTGSGYLLVGEFKALSSTGTHADAVIAKINERLDMLSQLEGGRKADRYDHYESMDSRTSMASSRDLYRSGSYGYGMAGVTTCCCFDDYSSYGVAKMRQNMRESFSGGQGPSGGWASAGHHSPRRGGNAGGRGAAGGFSRGHSPGGGRGKLPSLLSNRMYPESGGFHRGLGQGPQHFPGRHFGGGPRAGRQRGRKRPLNKVSTSIESKICSPRSVIVRVMFACSVCKYRSFYKDDMESHIDSRFHKDHFKFLTSQLSKPTTDFLQEYLQNKLRKTEYRVGQMENHSAAICQLYKDQDLTRELGLEHFMKKVEAAHCSACDLFIPMQPHLIQSHIKSPDHSYNRKVMMEQSKRAGLSIARSILNHKLISKKLESYLKGENPFFDNPDEQEPDDSMAMDVSGAEASGEQAASQPLEGLLPSEVLEGEPEGDSLATQEEAAEEPTAEGGTEAAPGEENMEEAEGTELPPEEEGFELGDEEESSYVVQDEFTEGLDLGEGTADAE